MTEKKISIKKIDFNALMQSHVQNWKKILKFSGGVTVIIGVIVFLMHNKYTTETSLLPELDKNKLLGLMGSTILPL